MLIQYTTNDLRELNEHLRRAFQAVAGMSPDEVTACRRAVMHGMPIPFHLSPAHEQLVHDLTACLKQAQQRRLAAVVGYCMAAAQSPDVLIEANGIHGLVMDFIRQTVAPPAKVLDVASGTGHFGVPLAAEGYQVTLLDPAAPFLDAAVRRAGPPAARNITALICGTFEDLAEMAPKSYDACLCLRSVFYAHPRKSAEQTIVDLGRIAKKAVAVDAMSKEGLIRRLDAEGFDASPQTVKQIRRTGVTPPAKPEGGRVVYSCFSLDELRQVLARAGLVIHQLLGCTFGGDASEVEHGESKAELYPHLLALCRTRDVTECAVG